MAIKINQTTLPVTTIAVECSFFLVACQWSQCSCAVLVDCERMAVRPINVPSIEKLIGVTCHMMPVQVYNTAVAISCDLIGESTLCTNNFWFGTA